MEDRQDIEISFHEMEKLNMETIHLTNISNFFPELVWDQVMNKLKATNDIESCSNSSPYFRKLLQKKREVQLVIPAVFQILLFYLIDEDYSEESENEDQIPDPETHSPDIEQGIRDLDIGNIENLNFGLENFERGENQEDEHNFENENQEEKDNSMNAIWNCRLVSKLWNSAIDALFTHKDTGHYILRYDMNNTNLKYLKLDPWCNDEFTPYWPPQYFMEHFDPTHLNFENNKVIKNPFIGRSVQFFEVQIYFQQGNEHFAYLDGILEFLKKYGSEIWYVLFDFQNNLFNNDPVELYQRFQEFLTHLPNLKVLRVDYRDIIIRTSVILENEHMRNYVFGLLDEAITLNPMPTLPKLEFMSLTNLPTPIFNELIIKNRHIGQLQMDRKAYHEYYSLFWVQFSNLTTLNIKIASVKQFEIFENSWFPMQLEKVYLWFDGPFIPWSRIFHALESKFGDTCKELLIQMPMPKTEEEKQKVLEESHVCRLNLQKLKDLTIFDDALLCLDFLLPSQNTLEDICIRYTDDKNENSLEQHLKNQKFVSCQQSVQFVGFKEKMEQSNIWTQFPRLTRFTLHRSQKMGECVTYRASLNENNELGFRQVRKRVWSRVTRQNID